MRYLLVPAAGIRRNQPDSCTLARCQKTLELWKTGKYDQIISSGGVFEAPENQTDPAGEIIARFLTEGGIPSSCIVIENQALDTFENIRFSLSKIREKDFSVTVVTGWQHGLRFFASFLLGYAIFVRCRYAKCKQTAGEWLREWILLAYHLVDPKGRGYFARQNRIRRSRTGT